MSDKPRHGSPKPQPRYRIEESEGNPHGDIYEMEITSYFQVIDNETGECVLAFTGEYFTTLGDFGWNEGHYWGVESVVLTEDGQHVIVRETGKEPRTVEIPEGKRS